jgi:hypothetical protein
MEHDAVIVAPLPEFPNRVLLNRPFLCNVSRPSFGWFSIPPEGLHRFSSGPLGFLKGAHGYVVNHHAAKILLSRLDEAEPADLYLRLSRFPFISEFYPWCIECRDDFSTIQQESGCRAKHRTVRPV